MAVARHSVSLTQATCTAKMSAEVSVEALDGCGRFGGVGRRMSLCPIHCDSPGSAGTPSGVLVSQVRSSATRAPFERLHLQQRDVGQSSIDTSSDGTPTNTWTTFYLTSGRSPSRPSDETLRPDYGCQTRRGTALAAFSKSRSVVSSSRPFAIASWASNASTEPSWTPA